MLDLGDDVSSSVLYTTAGMDSSLVSNTSQTIKSVSPNIWPIPSRLSNSIRTNFNYFQFTDTSLKCVTAHATPEFYFQRFLIVFLLKILCFAFYITIFITTDDPGMVYRNESSGSIPLMRDLSSPTISECSDIYFTDSISGEPDNGNPPTPVLSDSRCDDSLNPNAAQFTPGRVAHDFLSCKTNVNSKDLSSDKESPHIILQNLRLKNVDKIIIGHININSIRNKIHILADLIRGRVDILLISETKIDASFPAPQFFLSGFSQPRRLDRTSHGGGLLLFIRDDIPMKPLSMISGNIECIIQEVNISKKKWLLIGIYNPNKSQIANFLSTLEINLCHYLSSYDNVIILGDFNSEIKEEDMNAFCSLYNLKSLIKVPTCFKSAKKSFLYRPSSYK